MTNVNKPGPSKPYRILLAEDNPVVQLVTRQILERASFDIIVVGDGNDALRELSTTDYDLVLMDASMPGLDGLEATRKIRDKSSPVRRHDISIIALTGLESERDQQACIEAGMDDYLEKPVDPDVLIAAINRHIGIASADAHGDQAPDEPVNGIGDDIIDRFLDDIPQIIDDLERIRSDGDITDLMNTGHRIKGAADLLGAKALSRRSRALEAAAREGDHALADHCARRLTGELQRLLSAVQGEH